MASKTSTTEQKPTFFLDSTNQHGLEKEHKLPYWDKDMLKQFFHQYDWSDNNAGLDDDELLAWMIEVNTVEDDEPTTEDALLIIKENDKTGDEMMQHSEMEEWLVKDSQLSKTQRLALSNKSDSHRRVVRFMESMVKSCYDKKNPYNDKIKPGKLKGKSQQFFDTAMMKLRGSGISREVLEMLRMLDRERIGVIPTLLFKTTMMGSKWHLSIKECASICHKMSGVARIINYNDFSELLRAKLNDKDEDKKVRMARMMMTMKRAGDENVSKEQIAMRWDKMNSMAEKAKIRTKERANLIKKKQDEKSGHQKQIKQIEMERIRLRKERLAMSHVSYRDQSNNAFKKFQKQEENDKYRKFRELKQANAVKYDKRRSPKGSVAASFEGFAGKDATGMAALTGSSEPPLFDGTVEPLIAGSVKKPFADSNAFDGMTSSLSKASVMSRPKFETWEKHINCDGLIFFHNPSKKKSSWNLPACSILIDCTEDEVLGIGGIDDPNEQNNNGSPEASNYKNNNNNNYNNNDSDPLRSIFASHPVWDESQTPAFNELRRIGILSLEPTDAEEAHEHLTERLIDRDLHKKGIYPIEVKYHDLQSSLPDKLVVAKYLKDSHNRSGERMNPKRPTGGSSPEKMSPRKRNVTVAAKEQEKEKLLREQIQIQKNQNVMDQQMKLERKASHQKLEDRKKARSQQQTITEQSNQEVRPASGPNEKEDRIAKMKRKRLKKKATLRQKQKDAEELTKNFDEEEESFKSKETAAVREKGDDGKGTAADQKHARMQKRKQELKAKKEAKANASK